MYGKPINIDNIMYMLHLYKRYIASEKYIKGAQRRTESILNALIELTYLEALNENALKEYCAIKRYLVLDEVTVTPECDTLVFKVEINRYRDTDDCAWIQSKQTNEDFDILMNLANKLRTGE